MLSQLLSMTNQDIITSSFDIVKIIDLFHDLGDMRMIFFPGVPLACLYK